MNHIRNFDVSFHLENLPFIAKYLAWKATKDAKAFENFGDESSEVDLNMPPLRIRHLILLGS